MTLALLIIAWIGLPLGLWLILRPKTADALPIIAIVISITLLAVSQWLQTDSTLRAVAADQNRAYVDTYYVLSHGYYLQWLSLSYLVVVPLTALIARLAQRLTLRLMAPGFWMHHLGYTAFVLQPLIATAYMPRRYVDYPVWFAWANRINFTGAMLSYVGLAILTFLTLTALLQTFLWRKT